MDVGECFHNNFRVGFWAYPLGYKRFGLGITSVEQKFAKQQRMAMMWLVRHVLTRL